MGDAGAIQRVGGLRRAGAVLLCSVVAGLLGPIGPTTVARADTAPTTPGAPLTYSADALPTVQVNGVVWSQVIVGNRVYVTGSFTSARPAGSAPGRNEVRRSHLLAYDLSTGALIDSWAPALNQQGLAIAASADGSRIFVGGDFTEVSGLRRSRLVALDAVTGAPVSTFHLNADARVRALAVAGDTVYAGGIFTTVAGQPRSRLAAFSTAGVLNAWAPRVNDEVQALVAPAGSGRVVAGGRFTTLNGSTQVGMAAIDAGTGATLRWPANTVVRNSGRHAAITSLSSDGTQVYGSGYTFGPGGNLESTFAADLQGNLVWVSGCRGDTYSTYPQGGVLYNVSHAHDCSMVGGLPQSNPWTFQRAAAQTTTPSPLGRVNSSGGFSGRPVAENLHWLPTLAPGTVTGMAQAAWHVTGNGQYIVLGGEFPTVNGTPQQGLVRMAVREVAPNLEGPNGRAELKPALSVTGPGAVRANVRAAWDRDNLELSYELLRGPNLSTSVVVDTTTRASTWWSRPSVTLVDSRAPVGAQAYRVRVRDALGNQAVSDTVTATVTSPAPPPAPGGGPGVGRGVGPGAGPGTVLATDSFDRVLVGGLGAAAPGGTWTTSGTGSTFAADGAAAVVTVPAGRRATAALAAVTANSTDVTHTVSLPVLPTGGGAYLATTARSTPGGDYRARLRIAADGSISAGAYRVLGSTETLIGTVAVVPGSYTPGSALRVRVQALGVGPTTLQLRVWPDGMPEPTTWLSSVTDGTPGLQVGGSVGVDVYTSASATTAVTARFDDLRAVLP